MKPATILFLAANPAGTSQLSLDNESRSIGQKIRASEYRDSLKLVTEWAVRPDDLLQYLNEHQPYVVHFSGHGTEEQQIILVDDAQRPKPVSAPALKQLFTTLKGNIRVVVLNACYSKAQAEAIVQVIDCAIGMSDSIGDEAAIAFAASFYRAVGFGKSVREAFEQGKTSLMLEGIPEENTPTLLVRAGVDPATLFVVDRPSVARGDVADADADESAEPAPPAPPAKAKRKSGVTRVTPEELEAAAQRPPVATQPAVLNQILPGLWQVQIQVAFGAAQMQIELFPTGQFRGQLNAPMGQSAVEGQWQANPYTNQIGLSGQQTNGFQVVPYGVVIQVSYFDAQRIAGITNVGEQVSWQKLR